MHCWREVKARVVSAPSTSTTHALSNRRTRSRQPPDTLVTGSVPNESESKPTTSRSSALTCNEHCKGQHQSFAPWQWQEGWHLLLCSAGHVAVSTTEMFCFVYCCINLHWMVIAVRSVVTVVRFVRDRTHHLPGFDQTHHAVREAQRPVSIKHITLPEGHRGRFRSDTSRCQRGTEAGLDQTHHDARGAQSRSDTSRGQRGKEVCFDQTHHAARRAQRPVSIRHFTLSEGHRGRFRSDTSRCQKGTEAGFDQTHHDARGAQRPVSIRHITMPEGHRGRFRSDTWRYQSGTEELKWFISCCW